MCPAACPAAEPHVPSGRAPSRRQRRHRLRAGCPGPAACARLLPIESERHAVLNRDRCCPPQRKNLSEHQLPVPRAEPCRLAATCTQAGPGTAPGHKHVRGSSRVFIWQFFPQFPNTHTWTITNTVSCTCLGSRYGEGSSSTPTDHTHTAVQEQTH